MSCDLTPYIEALHEIASDAGLVLLGGAGDDTLQHAASRYNIVCHNLIDTIPAVGAVYRLLPAESSPGALRIAARDVAEFVRTLSDRCCKA